jgi:nucleoid-associated protein YgaU
VWVVETTWTSRIRSDAALALAILLLGFILVATGGTLMERWEHSSARQQSLAFEDLLGLVANASGLMIVAWWVITLLIALASAVLERTGQKRAAEATGKFSPAFMRRLALAAVGIQLISAPLANAATAPEDPGWRPSSSPGATVSAIWAPTAAETAGINTGPAVRSATGTPVHDSNSEIEVNTARPGFATAEPTAEPTDPHWKPSAPVIGPGAFAAQPIRSTRHQTVPAAGDITVVAGDSLWSIAARELGPTASDVDVAAQWPRWYQANRAVVGDNPDVLLPGQVLKPPSGA